MKIVFVQTRTHYDFRGEPCCVTGAHSGSYSDFWDLVKVSGFPTCYVDEIRLDQDIAYITSPVNGETRPHLANERKRVADPKAKVIWWDLERPQHGGEDMHALAEEITAYFDEIWVSDRFYATLYRSHPKVKFVVFGSDSRIAEQYDLEPMPTKQYDVIHLSAPSYTRYSVIGHLEVDNNIRVAGNCWRDLRHKRLLESRFMVNVHQTPVPMGEPLRFALAAAYKLPLISDRLSDPFPMVPTTHFRHAEREEMKSLILEMMTDPDENWAPMGQALHDLFCVKYNFAEQVRKAVGA